MKRAIIYTYAVLMATVATCAKSEEVFAKDICQTYPNDNTFDRQSFSDGSDDDDGPIIMEIVRDKDFTPIVNVSVMLAVNDTISGFTNFDCTCLMYIPSRHIEYNVEHLSYTLIIATLNIGKDIWRTDTLA